MLYQIARLPTCILSAAGQDCLVRVWEVAPTRGSSSTPTTPVESDVPLDDAAAAAAAGGGAEGSSGGMLADPSVAVFQQRPYRCAHAVMAAVHGLACTGLGLCCGLVVYSLCPACCRVYRGHKQDVLDLCWSKTQVRLRLRLPCCLPGPCLLGTACCGSLCRACAEWLA